MSNGVTWDTCDDCHGSGFKVVQRAGDPVPGHPGYRFASTLYAPCDCRSTLLDSRYTTSPGRPRTGPS